MIFTISLAGELWFPEDDPTYENPDSPGHVYPGRPYNWDDSELYKAKEGEWGASRHMTVVFNVFVWMQIFNFFPARRINDEKNFFEGMFKNWIFIAIFFAVSAL